MAGGLDRIPVISGSLQAHPLSSERWKDFETLFGARGACGGCWCMYFRQTQKEYESKKGPANHRAMKSLVDSGIIPGLIGYIDNEPAAWCSVAPREHFSRLARSRILKPVDNRPVWSIVCFFVKKSFRKQGIALSMLQGAVDYVRANGGQIVEGYPVEPKKTSYPDVFAYYGLASMFTRIGFTEIVRRSETRPIMRYMLINE